jgi:drug/metabolite transporter (DMT)-like permease
MAQEKEDRAIYALLFLGGVLFSTVSTTLSGGWSSIYEISWKEGVLLMYLGAIATGLCFFWWGRASKKVSAETLSVFNNVKLPLGVWVSSLCFGESVKGWILLFSLFSIGTALMLAERRKLSYLV